MKSLSFGIPQHAWVPYLAERRMAGQRAVLARALPGRADLHNRSPV